MRADSAMARFFAAFAFAFVLLATVLLPSIAHAGPFSCASKTTTVTNLPTALAIAPGTAAGTALAASPFTITTQFTNCTGDAKSQWTFWILIGNLKLTEPGFAGSSIAWQASGTPTFTRSAGCPTVTPSQNGNASRWQVGFAGSGPAYSNCTVTFTQSGMFYLGNIRVTGTHSLPAVGWSSGGYSGQIEFQCGDYPTCSQPLSIGTSSVSGTWAIPVYVTACAGVLSGTQTVQLPNVSTSTFLNNTTPAGKTRFQISLASCVNTASNGVAGNAGYQAHVSWSFTSCGASNVICNGGTSNVRLQILKSDAATAISNAVDDVYTLTDGTNVFQYYAAYVNPGGAAVTAGSVSATAQLTVTYQ